MRGQRTGHRRMVHWGVSHASGERIAQPAPSSPARGRSRPPVRWASLRLLAAYGLAAVLVSVPVDVALGGGGTGLSHRTLVAVVAGDSAGFVLDRDGEVVRIGADGAVRATASLGHYSTPFGVSVAGRA